MSTFVNILDILYPVGSIYQSMEPTSPSEIIGGTWEQIKTFLMGADESKLTGGEATHILTKSEIPNYKIGSIPEVVPGTHNNWDNGGIAGSSLGNASGSKPGVGNNNNACTITSGTQWAYQISTNGGDQPHNNLPPYTTCYIWYRVA